MMKRTKGKFKADKDWWRKTVRQNSERQQSKRKRPTPKASHFQERYDNLNKVVFKKDANINYFRALNKDVLLFEMSARARAIYPVLCCLSNYKQAKEFQVSIENIGTYSGLSDWSTIKKGLEELRELDLIKGEKVHNQRRYWIYDAHYIREHDIEDYKFAEWFPFHSCIVESGEWAKLTTKAQALYLVLRGYAKFEYDTSADYHHYHLEGYTSFKEIYQERRYELYVSTWKELGDRSGIHPTYLKTLVRQLVQIGLVGWNDQLSICAMSVYLRPLKVEEYWYG